MAAKSKIFCRCLCCLVFFSILISSLGYFYIQWLLDINGCFEDKNPHTRWKTVIGWFQSGDHVTEQDGCEILAWQSHLRMMAQVLDYRLTREEIPYFTCVCFVTLLVVICLVIFIVRTGRHSDKFLGRETSGLGRNVDDTNPQRTNIDDTTNPQNNFDNKTYPQRINDNNIRNPQSINNDDNTNPGGSVDNAISKRNKDDKTNPHRIDYDDMISRRSNNGDRTVSGNSSHLSSSHQRKTMWDIGKWAVNLLLAAALMSVPWEFVRLYQQEVSKRAAAVSQVTPSECTTGSTSLLQNLKSFFLWQFSWSTSNLCEQYYYSLLVDPLWELNPLLVISSAVTRCLLHPMELLFSGFGRSCRAFFMEIPVQWQPVLLAILTLLLLLIILTACSYRLHIPFLFRIEPRTPVHLSNTNQNNTNHRPPYIVGSHYSSNHSSAYIDDSNYSSNHIQPYIVGSNYSSNHNSAYSRPPNYLTNHDDSYNGSSNYSSNHNDSYRSPSNYLANHDGHYRRASNYLSNQSDSYILPSKLPSNSYDTYTGDYRLEANQNGSYLQLLDNAANQKRTNGSTRDKVTNEEISCKPTTYSMANQTDCYNLFSGSDLYSQQENIQSNRKRKTVNGRQGIHDPSGRRKDRIVSDQTSPSSARKGTRSKNTSSSTHPASQEKKKVVAKETKKPCKQRRYKRYEDDSDYEEGS